MNKEDDELYNVEKYSDNDLFTMLDLTNPSDRELEAKILMEIDKYTEINDSTAEKLKVFFEQVYKHFFEDEDIDSEYTEEDVFHEGFTTANDDDSKIVMGKNTIEQTNVNLKKIEPRVRSITTNLNYDKSALNPLLKETQKRILQLDSSFRDFENYKISTNYLINLSEVLHNVVSLKLHSVNIPYTWYNVGSNSDANLFLLKGVTPGVENVYEFKFEIAAGTYDITEMTTALNESVATLATTYPEVNFGTTKVEYNEKTTRLELTLDIKNIFTEIQYYLYFATNTNAFDVDVRQETIPSFLGFSTNVIPEEIALPTPSGVEGIVVPVEDTYTINSIYSNFQYMYAATGSTTGTPNSLDPLDKFQVIVEERDSDGIITTPGNNYLTFINYEGPGNYDPGTSVVLNTVTVTFIETNGDYTRGTIMEAVNRALLSSSSFTQNTMFQVFDVSYDSREVSGDPLTSVTMQRFQIIFTFEPSVVTYTTNMKQIVIFPDESDSSFTYPLWTGSNSVFMFDENIVFSQPNSIQGDIRPVSTIYDITSSPIIRVECTKPLYNNTFNNYSITLDNAAYTMNEYVGIINYTEQYKNSEINTKFALINPGTTKQYINSDVFYDIGSNKVRMQFDMLTSFDQTDYTLDMTTCFLSMSTFLTLMSPTISITDPTLNEFTGSTLISIFPFTIDNTNKTIDVSPKLLQGNSSVGTYTLTFPEGTYLSASQLTSAINNTFCTIQGENDGNDPAVSLNGLNMVQTRLSYVESGANYDWRFTYVIVNKMSDQNYEVIFEDPVATYPNNDGGTGTSWNSYLGFTETSYELVSSSVNDYTSEIVSDNNVYVDPDKTITIDETNNTFLFSPYSTIKGLYEPDNSSQIDIVVPDGTYGVYQLYNELNNLFNLTTDTNGTIIYSNFNSDGEESAVLQININKMFSAEDYELIFYNETKVVMECNMVNNTSATIGTGSRRTTTWDVTIGWLMGFRTYPIYQLSPTNINNALYVTVNNYTYNSTTKIITLTGDASVDMHIYKNLYLILDDFTQNHLNDGLVTGIRKNPHAEPASYSSGGTRICNPITNESQSSIFNSKNPGQALTERQLYAANIITEENKLYQTKKIYSDPPYVKDMFGLIPLKLGSLTHGDILTEFGGMLQDNDRKYFGPVNITKMNIKLLNDRGDILDLNGANWSFSVVFEYLYNFSGI